MPRVNAPALGFAKNPEAAEVRKKKSPQAEQSGKPMTSRRSEWFRVRVGKNPSPKGIMHGKFLFSATV